MQSQGEFLKSPCFLYKKYISNKFIFHNSEASCSNEVKDASSSLLDCAEDPRFKNSQVQY